MPHVRRGHPGDMLGPMAGDRKGWRSRLFSNRTAPELNDSEPPLASYTGGLRGAVGGVTRPLARLDLYRNGLRIRSSTRSSRADSPLWEAVFSELNEVQAVGSIKGLTTGIRFRTVSAQSLVDASLD